MGSAIRCLSAGPICFKNLVNRALIVDKGKFMTSSAIAVHPTNGRVFAATTLWPRGRHRITALSD